MINVSDVATGLLGLGVIAGAVGLVAVGGRDRTADQHDLTDYRPDPDAVRAVMCGLDVEDVRRRLRPAAVVHLDNRGATFTPHVLPLAPVSSDARAPLYAETLFRTWHPDAPAVVAARMLREIADDERAKAGIRPRLVSTADRDMTGAFPVVAVA